MNMNRRAGKRIEGILVSICLLFIFLTGCGEVSLQSGTNLQLVKDGSVMVTYIEDFSSDYYDLNELMKMNEEEVTAYNTRVGREAVEIVSTETDGQTVTLSMNYRNIDDYATMNGGSFFHGTVSQAVNSGYNLDHSFIDVKTGEQIATMDWDNLADYHLVIAKGPEESYTATIHTYKKIVYATANVTVSDNKKMATIKGNEQAFIVFQ